MAIQQTIKKEDNSFKKEFKDAYLKIDDFIIDPLIGDVNIGVRGYADKYARENNANGVLKKNFILTLSDLGLTRESLLAIAYEKLTETEFKGSTKV